jgi:hypothetical protein
MNEYIDLDCITLSVMDALYDNKTLLIDSKYQIGILFTGVVIRFPHKLVWFHQWLQSPLMSVLLLS